MEADGYSLDDKRNKIEQNDIPEIIEYYHKKESESYQATRKHFFIDIKEIQANEYDLSINRYKTVEYEEVKYPPTQELILDIEALSKKIDSDLKELKTLLGVSS